MKQEIFIKVNLPSTFEEQEILVAMLPSLGFYAFEEEQDTLYAFIKEEEFALQPLQNLLSSLQLNQLEKIDYTKIVNKDWNEEWEKTFKSITIEDFVCIHPPFNPLTNDTEHNICIAPKMSFGTGHHETTRLMVKMMRTLNFEGKKVLDLGSGTGVLAILASKLGAREVVAVDIDEWCFENAQENISLNEIKNIRVQLGDASAVKERDFDVVLANINRNVLLSEGEIIAELSTDKAELLLSGFFEFDSVKIADYFRTFGYTVAESNQDNGWVCFSLKKHK